MNLKLYLWTLLITDNLLFIFTQLSGSWEPEASVRPGYGRAPLSMDFIDTEVTKTIKVHI